MSASPHVSSAARITYTKMTLTMRAMTPSGMVRMAERMTVSPYARWNCSIKTMKLVPHQVTVTKEKTINTVKFGSLHREGGIIA